MNVKMGALALSSLLLLGGFSVTAAERVLSSNHKVIQGLTRGRGVPLQTIAIRVDQLATNETWVALTASATEKLTTKVGVFDLFYRGKLSRWVVKPGMTYRDLVTAINARNMGVRATLLDTRDGSARPVRLTLTDVKMGKEGANQAVDAYNITINTTLTHLTAADFGETPNVLAKDTVLHLNYAVDQPIFRSATLIDDLIPGVVLVVKASDPNEFITLNVIDERDLPPGAPLCD